MTTISDTARALLIAVFILLSPRVSAQDFTLAKDFSVRLLREDGTPLDSIGGKYPAHVKVEITAVEPNREFRIHTGEVVLARTTSRVAALNTKSKNVDLTLWRAQVRPGDQVVFNYKISEVKDGKMLEPAEWHFRYTFP